MKPGTLIIRGILVFSLLLFAKVLCFAEAIQFSTATGDHIEYDGQTGRAKIDGDAFIKSSTGTVKADHILIDRNEKTTHAEGNVELIRGDQILRAQVADYNWETYSGTFLNASGVSPPWRFSAERLIDKSKNEYQLSDGTLTSCDAIPPHYRIRGTRGRMLTKERANFRAPFFVLEDAPVIWLPFFSRSLEPKKYTLRLEPGHTGRDGYKLRTILGYPFTPNSYTRVTWDYLQKTGNGVGLNHWYSLPNLRGELDSYFINDVNPDPDPKKKRYSAFWNHYQKVNSRLTANAKIDLKSDVSVGNQFSNTGNQILVENSRIGVNSEAGFSYQFSKAAMQVDFTRNDRFDSAVSSKTFISNLVIPSVSLTTIPIIWKYFPFYTSFSASWINQTNQRSTPEQTLRYQKSGNAGVQLQKDFRLWKKWAMTPHFGYAESWQDRDLNFSTATKDVYLGRYNTGLDIRRRIARKTDMTLSHIYVVRLERNRLNKDTIGADRGIETNLAGVSIATRFKRDNRISVQSGYDIRSAPRDDPQKYHHRTERVTPPTLDVQLRITPLTLVYFNETYSLFDGAVDKVVRTPLNTSGGIQFGDSGGTTYFSQGFSYGKKAPGQNSTLNLSNKLRFFLTRKWFFDLFLSYRAVGKSKINYSKVTSTEKNISIVRDLHCWLLRMTFSERGLEKEAYFRVDLRTNYKSEDDVFKTVESAKFMPFREPQIPESKIFGVNE